MIEGVGGDSGESEWWVAGVGGGCVGWCPIGFGFGSTRRIEKKKLYQNKFGPQKKGKQLYWSNVSSYTRSEEEGGEGGQSLVVVVVQNFDKRLERGKEGAGSKKAFDAAPAIQQG